MIDDVPLEWRIQPVDEYACGECDVTFASKAGKEYHLSRQHG